MNQRVNGNLGINGNPGVVSSPAILPTSFNVRSYLTELSEEHLTIVNAICGSELPCTTTHLLCRLSAQISIEDETGFRTIVGVPTSHASSTDARHSARRAEPWSPTRAYESSIGQVEGGCDLHASRKCTKTSVWQSNCRSRRSAWSFCCRLCCLSHLVSAATCKSHVQASLAHSSI